MKRKRKHEIGENVVPRLSRIMRVVWLWLDGGGAGGIDKCQMYLGGKGITSVSQLICKVQS